MSPSSGAHAAFITLKMRLQDQHILNDTSLSCHKQPRCKSDVAEKPASKVYTEKMKQSPAELSGFETKKRCRQIQNQKPFANLSALVLQVNVSPALSQASRFRRDGQAQIPSLDVEETR